ncbi:MAG: DUF6314 family protein [Acidobacteriia bacterium]|nr:DUF6314 family protein [Terriglobia bacterium]
MTDSPVLLHGLIAEAWDRLQCIRHLRIVAASHTPLGTSWIGRGEGRVGVQLDGPMIVFTETGIWHIGQADEVRFRNVYRWSRAEDHIRLEHLRHGPSRPVHLCDLISRDDVAISEVALQDLVPIRPHQCGEDVYESVLAVADDGIVLDWTIRGPQKAAEIHVVYS